MRTNYIRSSLINQKSGIMEDWIYFIINTRRCWELHSLNITRNLNSGIR